MSLSTSGDTGLGRILRNALSSYGREGVDIALFLVLTPFILQALGTETFGLWALVWASIGFLGLMDFGFSTSVVKFVAEARGLGDANRLRTATATLFWIYCGLGGLTLATALLVARSLPGLLSLEGPSATAMPWVFALLSVRVAVAMPLGMFSGILIGFQRQAWANAIRMAESVTYAATVIAVLSVRPDVRLLALVSAVTGVGSGMAGAVLVMRRLEGVSVRLRDVRLEWVRELSDFSLHFFVIQVSMLMYTRLDTLLVHGFVSLGAVAYYSVAARVAERAAAFCRQLTSALTSVVAELHAAGDRSGVEAAYIMGSVVSTALAVPLLGGLAWLADDLLVAWMGAEFAEGAWVLRLLSLAMLVSVVHAGPANLLSMTGSHRYLARAFGFGQVLNLGLTLALLPRFGIAGAAAATLVATLFTDVVVVQRRASREFRTTRFAFYRRVVGPSLLPTLLLLGALALLGRAFGPMSLMEVALAEAVACAVFAFTFLLVGLPARRRRSVLPTGLAI